MRVIFISLVVAVAAFDHCHWIRRTIDDLECIGVPENPPFCRQPIVGCHISSTYKVNEFICFNYNPVECEIDIWNHVYNPVRYQEICYVKK